MSPAIETLRQHHRAYEHLAETVKRAVEHRHEYANPQEAFSQRKESWVDVWMESMQ